MKDHPSRSTTPTSQTWKTAAYAVNGRFVATLATAVVELLNPQPGASSTSATATELSPNKSLLLEPSSPASMPPSPWSPPHTRVA